MNKNNQLSLAIGDSIRWLLAIALIPLFLYLIFLSLIYPFEWLLLLTSKWSFIYHFIFWVFIGGVAIGFFQSISVLISYFSLYLVRQSVAYTIIFGIGLFSLAIFLLYCTWSNNVEFSWEYLPYRHFNRILFSLLILGLLGMPFKMYSHAREVVV